MRRFPAASLFSLLLATGVLGGCVHDAESAIEVRGEALSYVLAEQVQSVARGTTVNLADLAPFRWERLYVFAPGTSASVIRDSVRVAWPGLTRFVGSTMPDSVSLLVFVGGGQVLAATTHPRSRGDFAPERAGRGYGPAEAVFRVEASSTDPRRRVLR